MIISIIYRKAILTGKIKHELTSGTAPFLLHSFLIYHAPGVGGNHVPSSLQLLGAHLECTV